MDLIWPYFRLGWARRTRTVLMIKVAAAMLLLLGSGLIFKALVEMDAPFLRLRPATRRPRPTTPDQGAPSVPLRRAA
jgi:hypothetical protein